jgi:hypothetical protein
MSTSVGSNYRSLEQICTGPSSSSEQSSTVHNLNHAKAFTSLQYSKKNKKTTTTKNKQRQLEEKSLQLFAE